MTDFVATPVTLLEVAELTSDPVKSHWCKALAKNLELTRSTDIEISARGLKTLEFNTGFCERLFLRR